MKSLLFRDQIVEVTIRLAAVMLKTIGMSIKKVENIFFCFLGLWTITEIYDVSFNFYILISYQIQML